MVKCVRCKRDVRAGDYDTHVCSTLPTKVEVKMASRVLKRLPTFISPEQYHSSWETSELLSPIPPSHRKCIYWRTAMHIIPWAKEWHVGFGLLGEQIHARVDTLQTTYHSMPDKVQQLLSIMKEQLRSLPHVTWRHSHSRPVTYQTHKHQTILPRWPV